MLRVHHAYRPPELVEAFADPEAVPARVAGRYVDLLEHGVANPTFHPNSEQIILDVDRRVFAVLRSTDDRGISVLCLINVSAEDIRFELPAAAMRKLRGAVRELLTGKDFTKSDLLGGVTLAPYQVCWYSSQT